MILNQEIYTAGRAFKTGRGNAKIYQDVTVVVNKSIVPGMDCILSVELDRLSDGIMTNKVAA